MHIFIQMDPPTITGQMRKVRVLHGKPVFYDPPEIKEVRQTFCGYLSQGKPAEPLEGPIRLRVLWLFPRGKHRNGEWRITRPDTDNLEKLLKDCMTAVGFWKNDAQVASETIEKRWSDEPCGIYIEVEVMTDGQCNES